MYLYVCVCRESGHVEPIEKMGSVVEGMLRLLFLLWDSQISGNLVLESPSGNYSE